MPDVLPAQILICPQLKEMAEDGLEMSGTGMALRFFHCLTLRMRGGQYLKHQMEYNVSGVLREDKIIVLFR